MSVTYAECPLVCKLSEKIVDCYNGLDTFVEKLPRKIPSLDQILHPKIEPESKIDLQPSGKSLADRHGEIRKLIARPRYQVGFLGGSGVGKSTTLNSLLGFPLLRQGRGWACTSVVTRIRFIDEHCSPNMCCRYWKVEEYRDRRAAVAFALGFCNKKEDAIPWNEDQFIEKLRPFRGYDALPNPNEQHPANTAPAGETADELHRYLFRLVRSGTVHAEHFGTERHENGKDLTLKRVSDLLLQMTSHDGQIAYAQEQGLPTDSSEYLLLKEVEVCLPLKRFRQDVELVDMPGLLANVADDDMTGRFISDMDALFVLLESTHVKVFQILKYVKAWRREKGFTNLEGRAWMAFTRFRDTSKATLYPSDKEPKTVFDGIKEAQVESLIPNDQVLFLETLAYESRQQDANFDSAILLHVNRDAAGKIILPGLTEFPEWEKPIRSLYLDDGGISALREVIAETVADRVHREVTNDVVRKLQTLIKDLAAAVKIAGKNQSNLDRRNLKDCGELLLSKYLYERREIVEIPGEQLRAKVQAALKEARPDADVEQTAEQVRDNHKEHAEELKEAALAQIGGVNGTVQQLYCLAAKQLRKKSAEKKDKYKLDELPLQTNPKTGKVESLNPCTRLEGDLWQEDANDPALYGPDLDSIGSRQLFLDDDQYGLDHGEYWDIMVEKVDLVIYQFMNRLANRLRNHMEILGRELYSLGQMANSQTTDVDLVDQILEELGKLQRDADSLPNN